MTHDLGPRSDANDRTSVYSFEQMFRDVETLCRRNDEESATSLANELWHLEQVRCKRKPQERFISILLQRLWIRFEAREIDARQMLVEAFNCGRAFEHLDRDEE